MKTGVELDQRLKDLLFELEDNAGSKLLIVVTDDEREKLWLRERITQELGLKGMRIATVSAESLRTNLLTSIERQTLEENPRVISLWGVDQLDRSSVDGLFSQLNVHRDWLIKLSLPIILWISNELLNRLITVAPDFWSRRTAVFYFSTRTTRELLGKLFSESHKQSAEWGIEQTLSDAFSKILTSERELWDCLRLKRAFSLQKTDDLIGKIRSGVAQLLEECRNGRQIEVAFSLWNMSRLDFDLQDMLDQLNPVQRSRFEPLYTDRNEVLLILSEKLVEILNEYLSVLEESIRQKKQVSLVSRARSVAVSEIKRMAIALGSSTEIPVAFMTEEEELLFASESPGAAFGDEESAFLAKAADDLESWLAGHTEQKPLFFSADEAELLRILYSNPSGFAAVADKLGGSKRQASEKIRFLERKVRLYLGLPARFQSNKA